jgi:hypothetical protein
MGSNGDWGLGTGDWGLGNQFYFSPLAITNYQLPITNDYNLSS